MDLYNELSQRRKLEQPTIKLVRLQQQPPRVSRQRYESNREYMNIQHSSQQEIFKKKRPKRLSHARLLCVCGGEGLGQIYA